MRQDGEQMKKLRMAEGNSVSRWGLWGLNPGSLHTGLGVVSRLKAQSRGPPASSPSSLHGDCADLMGCC